MHHDATRPALTPDLPAPATFTDPAAAVARLETIYDAATRFLIERLTAALTQGRPPMRVRAFYPEIRLTVTSHAKIDSRLSFGHVSGPGTYATTVTRPDLFRNYLTQQIGLLVQNHGVAVTVGVSDTPVPVHFAVAGSPICWVR